MFKKLLIVTLSITAFLCCAFFPKSFNVCAETQSITYVAFGDSIAEGYAINMKKPNSGALITGADTSYDLVEGSYVDLIRDELNKTYNTTAYNFAYSGDTCQDLLNFIAEFYDDENNKAKDSGVANPTYPSLTNGELYNNIKGANIITVCIGANNILQESKTLTAQYISGAIGITDIEETLKNKIVGYTDTETGQHVNGFYDEFGNLLTILYKLNKRATIYFTSVYNPFKAIIVDSSLSSTPLKQEMLDDISQVAEIAIAGGTDSSGNNYVGINNVIYDAINSFNSNYSSNFKFVDSKSSFDDKYSSSNKKNYNDYVNVHFEDITINSIISGEVNINDLSSVMDKYCDPHPTYEGHKLIANVHINAGLEVYLPEFNYLTKVNGNSLQASYALQKGQSLEFNTTVDNSNYTYSYTYTIKKDGATVDTITDNPATISYSDYGIGSYDIYLSIQALDGTYTIDVCADEKLTTINVNEVQNFTVRFVTDCDDVITPQEIEFGGKVTKPSVSKPNYQLVGWFTDEEFTSQWNFETDVVSSNITLYAKWQAITFDVTFDYNGGTLNGQNSLVVAVIQNGLVEKPNSSNEPTLSKHRLIGWFVNLSDEQPFDFNTPITGALTLHAKWEKVVFTVTFNYNGGIFNGESQKVVEVNKGDKLLKLANDPVKKDCKLVGWYKDLALLEPWDFENDVVTSDITIFAKWESNVVYVTLDYQGGIFNGNGSRVLKLEKGAELSAPTEGATTLLKSGYKFAYWYLTDNQVPLEFPLNVYEDITINAYWKEAIKINIYYYSEDIEWLIFKGTKVGELYDEIKPQKNGTRFLGWYEDASLTTEFEDDTVLENNQNVFIKWITLKCKDEKLLKQAYSPITKLVEWQIDAKNGTKLAWQVNNEIVKYAVVSGNEGESWAFAPTYVGIFEISCLIYDEVDQDEKPIGGTVVNGKTVEIVYSTPTDITITLTKVINKKTYVIEVDNRQYYDESKFAWFKTSDGFSNEFSIRIGVGFDLNYKFDSDCKICVKYLENEDSTDGLVSNIINVKVDNYVDETTLFSIVISLAVVALIAVGVIISRKKYKDFF